MALDEDSVCASRPLSLIVCLAMAFWGWCSVCWSPSFRETNEDLTDNEGIMINPATIRYTAVELTRHAVNQDAARANKTSRRTKIEF